MEYMETYKALLLLKVSLMGGHQSISGAAYRPATAETIYELKLA